MHLNASIEKAMPLKIRIAWDAFNTRFALNMRGRAVIAVFGLLIYTLAMAGFVMVKKEALLVEFNEMQMLYGADQSLRELRVSAFHNLLASHEAETSADPDAAMAQLQIDFQLVESTYASLMARLRQAEVVDREIGVMLDHASVSLASNDPTALQGDLKELIRAVEEQGATVRERLVSCTRFYHQESDELTHIAFSMAILGVVLFGFTVGFFFTNLADDLNRLKAKALDIVQGRRGEPLPIDRYDELGDLMVAVNKMQDDLARHQRELDLERQKGFHREKMVAIGTLAAGIAHEIGNPITAISGIAQEMCGVQGQHQCPSAGASCKPDMILEQTERIAKITRAVSEFSAPRSLNRELLDLNQLIRSTISLMRYDKRFRNIRLDLDLDNQLPAIVGVGDQLVQVVMNLLINAADACQHKEPDEACVTVATRACVEHVELSVSDNGLGMEPEIRSHATEAFFTTKPVGQGTGLGLAVCASVIDSHGGQLTLESEPARGTLASITLPIDLHIEETAT